MKTFYRSLFISLLLGLFASSCLSMTQTEKIPIITQVDLEKKGIDISALHAGKYTNYYYKAPDENGKMQTFGPFTLIVDPSLDLPRITLQNPKSGMRINGDLEINGTAADDDGVSRVEARIDYGAWIAAQGTDSFSLFVDTENIADGRRLVAVRAVDVHGLAGIETTVMFNLDRIPPVAMVKSPVPGSFIAGILSLSGTLHDASGIKSLELSTDDGTRFVPIGVKFEDRTGLHSFSYPLDTRKLPDGPLALVLRIIDGADLCGLVRVPIIVDNAIPVIEIAQPRTDDAVSGKFLVAGSAYHTLGIVNLTFTFGKEKGTIPIEQGNPFFSIELDASQIEGDKAEIIISARDMILNTTKATVSPRIIDRERDKPQITLSSPNAKSTVKPGDKIEGTIKDDDGEAFLRYSIDSGSYIELSTPNIFSFSVSDISSGKHELSLTAIDTFGTVSNPLILDIASEAQSITPKPSVATIPSLNKGTSIFSPNSLAILIGNKDYEQGMSTVDFALADVAAFRDLLLTTFSINPENIYAIENAGLADFYRLFGNSGSYMKSNIYRMATLRDTPPDLIIFYSGHGAPAIAGSNRGKGYLMPVDSDVMTIEQTAYGIDALIANIADMQRQNSIGRVWLVFDSCFSGRSSNGSSLFRNVSGLSVLPITPKNDIENSILMFASSGEEFASWYPEKKQGLFTYFLITGLRGEADTDHDGIITLTEIDFYLRSKVPRLANSLNAQDQTPQIIYSKGIDEFLHLSQ